MILNMLSTCTMIKLGKVYGNLMVDVKASNEKLVARARKIVMEATDCTEDTAIAVLKETNGQVKPAILMILANLNYTQAMDKLNANQGFIAKALANK